MRKLLIPLFGLLVCVCAHTALADIAVNLGVPDGRGDGDAPDPTLADFISVTATQLDGATTLLNVDPDDPAFGGGNGGGWNYFSSAPRTIGGIVVSATGNGNGFNAGDASHNDLDPITEGYAFGVAGQSITFAGLNAQANSGDTIVISAWGIGDNLGQDSDFSATYAGTTSAVQSTLYNDGSPRGDATGSIPVVHFTFVADGITDSIDLNVVNSGQVNAFSLAVTPAAVPEPSSGLLLAGIAFAGFTRRRRS